MEAGAKRPAGVAPGTPEVDRDRCKGCGLCTEFCPFGHLHLDEELNVAGYHPAEPEGREEAVAGLGPGGRHPPDGVQAEGYEHNFAYWCLRCRYCEIICPDAAVRLSGDVVGHEGTRGWEGDSVDGPVGDPLGAGGAREGEARAGAADERGGEGDA